MNFSQLERIGGELAEARHRAHQIVGPLTAELWSTRPAVDQWSVAECLIHLNLTSIISPFDSRLKYNLYACLRIIPAHQRQHLSQAEAVIRALTGR